MSGAESRYVTIDRDDWAALRAATPLTLRQEDLDKLRGINDQIDLDEVAAIYLPLSRLLNLRVSASQELARVSSTFLGQMAPRVPYVIGVAGSVAVGKSTFARILQALLSRWPDHPARRPRHHRRLPPPERGPRGARPDVPQGVPRELRHPPAAGVPARRQERGRRGARPGVQPRRLRRARRTRRRSSASPTSSSSKGSTSSRSAATPPSSSATTSTSRSTSMPRSPTSSAWFIARFMALRESVFKDPNSFFRHFAVLSDDEARGDGDDASGTTSTAATCARTSCRHESGRR